MLEAVKLTKRYSDGLLALDNLDLEIHEGELFCLLGANGAGKTTTINLFLDFIEPTSGKALIAGIEVARDPLSAKKHVSYVSENVMLYGNFTARENLAFFSRLTGRKDPDKEELYHTLEKVGLDRGAFEQRVKNFSKGMRQKLGIAVAMIKDAPAILLDEPTSGLDPKSAAEFMALLSDLREEGKAIFMSTHDIFRASEFADRVAIMKTGRLLATLSRDELKAFDLHKIYLDYMSN